MMSGDLLKAEVDVELQPDADRVITRSLRGLAAHTVEVGRF